MAAEDALLELTAGVRDEGAGAEAAARVETGDMLSSDRELELRVGAENLGGCANKPQRGGLLETDRRMWNIRPMRV